MGNESEKARRSRSRDFGHARKGWAVEFNMDGVCACRTLTLETREEAEQFKRLLDEQENTSDVEVVFDG